jgi:hypothetical protein
MLLIALFSMTAVFCASYAASAQTDSLSKSFTNPPPSARPQVWWHWVNGNISKPGITADLEAFKRSGIGGGTICNLGDYAPEGGVHFNSEPWWDDMKFAMSEAGRLGLELGVEDCQGWSSSGGPWVQPPDAMKMLVWSETQIDNGVPSAVKLPLPQTRQGYYHDIAVVAFPSTLSESGPNLSTVSASLTAGGNSVDSSLLLAGDSDKEISIPGGSSDNPGLNIDCHNAFTADVLRFGHGPDWGGQNVEVDYSTDGSSWKTATTRQTPGDLINWVNIIRFDPVTARYFRIVFRGGDGNSSGVNLTCLNLYGPGTGIDRIPLTSIVDVSSKLQSDGTLAWTPPAGNWTVIRFGYTIIGAVNHPANQYGIGLECDKLSKPALAHFFTGLMDRVMSTAATIPGKPVKWSLIDSYEIGYQNWTDDLPAVFKARTGYDITPWLITQTDRTVESADLTSRFQFDFTRTISEMWDSNYYGYFAELLHKHGILAQVEAYGDGTFDTVRASGLIDMPMSEYWWPGDGDNRLAKQAASAAHVYGHTLVGAESFTSDGPYFESTPWNLKREGDNIFAAGVNRYYFHSSPHQPYTDGRKPGMTWHYGIFITRNNTWFDTGKAYFTYLARCESMLQQGKFIGDILAYEGEEGNGGQSLYAPPLGYASDEIDRDLMLQSLTVDNGVLKLPSGESYRLLALANTQSISLAVLEKVEALVRAGAVVFGQPPIHSLGLIDYPNSESKVAQISAELWGNIDGKTIIKHRYGKGWVYWTGQFTRSDIALADQHIGRDFSFDDKDANIPYLHRLINGADVYFISNQENEFVATNASFRVAAKQPEIWDPQKGTLSNAAVWKSDGAGAETLPLDLAPGQSLFIVFRKAAPSSHLTSVTSVAAKSNLAESALTITKAVYGAEGHGNTIDLTATLQSMVKGGSIHVVISNTLAGSDPVPLVVKQARIDYVYNGKAFSVTVPENARFVVGFNEEETKYRVVQGAGGTPQLIAWAPGTFAVQSVPGHSASKVRVTPPAPFHVDGSWTVHFDPRWGGPASIVFDSLVDWTKRPEPGIKFYSGTAEYDKTINIPAAWLKSGRNVTLDLGNLESLANVTVNGHYLGCLWSPPYRVDVTGVVKPGQNSLQINITDSWGNRLIGDDALPANQRLTSTKEQFFSATDPLEPSGLFGPVTLIGADPVSL